MGIFSRQASGFSLAELLVALLILGQISAFTIPKIVTSQQNARNKAVFKEMYGTLSQLVYQGTILGMGSGSSMTNYIYNNVNATRICKINSSTEGCWDTTVMGATTESTQGGFVLHNGAVLVGFGTSTPCEGVYFDVNGPGGPNLNGEDQGTIGYNFTSNVAPPGWCASTKVGQVSMGATTAALFLQ